MKPTFLQPKPILANMPAQRNQFRGRRSIHLVASPGSTGDCAMAKYEGSAADRAKDKKGAKKAGVTMKAWEKSGADQKADAAGQRKLDAKKRKAK